MFPEVVKAVPYSEQTYKTLKDAIITNALKPGEVLNERDLATALNVSRTPLREALQLLQRDGWLTVSGKNKVVTQITWKDIEEIFQLRLVNEILALELASKVFDQEHMEELKTIWIEMTDQIDQDVITYIEADKSFHTFFVRVSGNNRLYQLMKGINEQFTRIGYLTLHQDDIRLKRTLEEHRIIYEACVKGDFNEAREAVTTHIHAWYESLKGKNLEDLHFR